MAPVQQWMHTETRPATKLATLTETLPEKMPKKLTDPKTNSVFRVADLPHNRPTSFELRPASSELLGLADELGLSGLRKLVFTGEIYSSGRANWALKGHLGATVVQPCVVSLTPVTTRIEVDAERRFLADMETPEDDTEVEMPQDDNSEPLGSHIDIATVMAETLALALPVYPRATDADLGEAVFTEPGQVAMTKQAARPFAGLASLRDQLEGRPKDGPEDGSEGRPEGRDDEADKKG